jgi:AcrR family transcriptional regulator
MTIPRTSRSEERRARLLRAGLDAFGSLAYDDVLVSKVASDAGVAAGLPFHYFGSKRGFYIEVMRFFSSEIQDSLVMPADTTPGVAARRMLDSNLDWFERHPNALRELVLGGLGTDPEIRSIFDEARWEGASKLLDLAGYSDVDEDARLFIEGWIAMKDEIIVRWLGHPSIDREALVETLVQLFADVLERVGASTPARLANIRNLTPRGDQVSDQS